MKKGDSSTSKWIQKGRRVWVKALSSYKNPFEDAFLEGQIVDTQNNNNCRVLLSESKQQFQVPLDDCLKLTYGARDVSDMVDLQELNEPELLFNIKRRYVQDCIFTYCGPTLLIINPYTKIQRLFNEAILQEYQSHVFSDTLQYKTLAPHIFALAAFCLWQLFDNERNQSIVISGESGAGKTQNTKYCLKFLASLGKNMKQLINESYSNKKHKMNNNLRAAERAVKKTNAKVFGIEEKILGCNQILEAFGNSKTIRNDNSSRFGKLILLVYGQTQIEIKSAFIISYLLEKSRIVSVSQGQRNYHIFYYFVKGTSSEEKTLYKLKNTTTQYNYLNQSTVNSIPGCSDQQKFHQIKKEFQLYLNQDEIDAVLRILSVVLNLGNITFKKTQTVNSGDTATITNPEYLQIISQLLQISNQDLSHSFSFRTRKMGLSVMSSPLRYEEAISLRDSFAKNIYEKTFNFLIKKMNQKIEIQQVSLDQEKNTFRKSIGLLDIFGFQVLNNNSLQQFFINFANQKLQQLYVSYIFKEEQNQFMRQGLREFSHDIGFQDNKPIIDLFENYPLGIFHLINQSSELNQDDKDLPSSIEKNHLKNKFLKIPKTKRSAFQIIHSCSPVSYNTSGFTIKNKDQFPQQLLEVIQKTKSEDIRKICIGDQVKEKAENKQKTGRNADKKFLGSKFLNSMNTLIQELYSCDCHFVRCIKPNSKKSPKLFNSQAVLQSLRYLGVLDSIIIRKLGYIYRRPFKEFYKKFYQLDNYIYSFHQDVSKLKTEEDFKKQCQKIINKYLIKQFEQNNILLGHKKILIKESTLNHLQLLTKEKRKLRISVANKFKNMYKNALFRSHVKTFLHSIKVLKVHMKLLASDIREKILNTKVTKIQNVIKKFLWQKRLQKIKQEATKSVTKISAYFKMKSQRKKYLKTKEQIKQIQANVRLFLTMGKMLRERQCRRWVLGVFQNSWESIKNKKAVLIQKIWKGFLVRKKFREAIQRMKKNVKLSKIKGRFKRALFVHKYNKFREALQKYRNPIIKLQAIVKGKFLHRVYTNVKKSTLMIQRAYRRHLMKKFYLSKEWQAYKNVLRVNEKGKQIDRIKMGFRVEDFERDLEIRQLDETQGLIKKILPSEMTHCYRNLNEKNDKLQMNHINQRINQTIESGQKNTIQMYLLDYDSHLDYSRNTSILQLYEKLKNELKLKSQYLIYGDLTENHLVLLSNKQKLYLFNLSNQSLQQLSVPNTIQKIYASQQNAIIKTYQQNQLYHWDLSKIPFSKSTAQSPVKTNNGKLINSKINSNEIEIKASPSKFKQSISKGVIPFDTKKQPLVVYISKGQKQYAISSSKIYQKIALFGSQTSRILKLSQKIMIVEVAASYHFMHVLTNVGTVYSKGRNNRGQLGLGTVSTQIKQLQLNNQFLKQKQFIQSVSAGMRHSVAKSKLGYAYTWGDNSFGQISSQQQYSHIPKKIQFEGKPLKTLQVTAGFRTTYFLTQALKIMVCGASILIQTNSQSPIRQITILQDTNYKSKFLNVIKIKSIWNQQSSILTGFATDSSKCKQGSKSDAILKYLKVLAKQWIQNTVYPPYHEFIDNCLNLSDLRKLKFKQKTQLKSQSDKKTNDKLSKLQELKLLIEVRKTSSIFKEAAKVKTQQFLQYLEEKKRQKWTDQEKQLFDLIMNDMKKSSQ